MANKKPEEKPEEKSEEHTTKFHYESVYRRMMAARNIHEWHREEQELWRKQNQQKKAEKKESKSPQ